MARMRPPVIAVIATALALGAPTVALAQSVGDEQYRDPFAGEEQAPEQTGDESAPAPAPTPAPAPAPTTSPTPTAPPTTPSGEPIATVAGELPRTGGEQAWVAAIGMLALATGAGLRRTTRT
jgi:LPXTG-motif cell wall-anchored protein